MKMNVCRWTCLKGNAELATIIRVHFFIEPLFLLDMDFVHFTSVWLKKTVSFVRVTNAYIGVDFSLCNRVLRSKTSTNTPVSYQMPRPLRVVTTHSHLPELSRI